MSRSIFHITARQQWQQAQSLGIYEHESLPTEGFIHCSRREQVAKVANLFFSGQTDLVLLKIACDRLQAELRDEAIETGEIFPHIYGAINLDAVEQVLPFEPNQDGRFEILIGEG